VLKITNADASPGRLEGVIFFEYQPEKQSVYFGPFAVRPECNGRGYGKLLIKEMELQAKLLFGAQLKYSR